MDEATFDDALNSLIEDLKTNYKNAFPQFDKEKWISQTQLKAIAAQTGSRGMKGLVEIINERGKRDIRNAEAYKQSKGGKRPQNPSFWLTLQPAPDHIKKLVADERDEDLVSALFAERLAAEFAYAEALKSSHNREEGRGRSTRRRS